MTRTLELIILPIGAGGRQKLGIRVRIVAVHYSERPRKLGMMSDHLSKPKC